MDINLKEVEVQKLNLGPGDCLSIAVGIGNDDKLTESNTKYIVDRFAEIFPDNRISINFLSPNQSLDYKIIKNNDKVNVKIKKLHPNATIPKYAKPGDAGLDLVAVDRIITDKYVEYDTGLAFEIPNGYVGLLFPRSSITNKDIVLKNSVGVLDSQYRNSVKFRFWHLPDSANDYSVGERIGQLIILPYPQIVLEEVQELSDTERGFGGFGSSGK